MSFSPLLRPYRPTQRYLPRPPNGTPPDQPNACNHPRLLTAVKGNNAAAINTRCIMLYYIINIILKPVWIQSWVYRWINGSFNSVTDFIAHIDDPQYYLYLSHSFILPKTKAMYFQSSMVLLKLSVSIKLFAMNLYIIIINTVIPAGIEETRRGRAVNDIRSLSVMVASSRPKSGAYLRLSSALMNSGG